MALSVALLSLHHREPVSTYLTQMCRPRKAGQRQQQSPIQVWSPPAPPPASQAEPPGDRLDDSDPQGTPSQTCSRAGGEAA